MNRASPFAGWLNPILLAVAVLASTSVTQAQVTLVRDGQPQARIVTAEQPPRMAALAARELQTYLEKISGAAVPIVSALDDAVTVNIYVGRSAHTDKLNISIDGLNDGAFRMASGENWLALVGRDVDYTPVEPWARNGGKEQQEAFFAAWDKLTGNTWGNPYGHDLFRYFSRSMNAWSFDERGSLNAVYHFLQDLGVRWYMPGPLGEIVPKLTTVTVPKVDKVVKPDFGLRYMHYAFFSSQCQDDIMWYLRMGLNNSSAATGPALLQSHGMAQVHARTEFRTTHPDYFALWNGKRALELERGHEGKPCLSSAGLFDENVRYLRTMFDHYQLPMGSLFPADGYSSVCGCPQCVDKSTPERGWTGAMSDYVWDYVNRVAQELYKTHPDRLIGCFAYGTYLKPPAKIDKLSPNLVVGIVQPRRQFDDPAKRQEFVDLRAAWLSKTASGKLIIWDHYPFTAPGKPSYGVPLYFPHAIAADLRSLQGISVGEILEVMFDIPRDFALHAPAFNHLNLYVTSQCYWNANLDIEALLNEYYTSFYGPAAAPMKTFIEYCEANFSKLSTDVQTMTQALALATQAQESAPAGTPYRQRIDELVLYLEPLKDRRTQLSKGREDVPTARMPVVNASGIQIDGKLDEDVWKEARGGYGEYGLSELLTGKLPTCSTSFKMLWSGNSIYFGIQCTDRDTNKLNIGSTKAGDPAIWNGDVIEVLLETQKHSYYQITVNPAGAVVDLDRVSGINPDWSAQAQIATQISSGSWTVEMCIPVVEANDLDPLHNVIGFKPTPGYPWFFNVCRQRVRENETELSAFSPTSKSNFHEIGRFGKLFAE